VFHFVIDDILMSRSFTALGRSPAHYRAVYPSAEELQFLTFEPEIFYFLLLPPIIVSDACAHNAASFTCAFFSSGLVCYANCVLSHSLHSSHTRYLDSSKQDIPSRREISLRTSGLLVFLQYLERLYRRLWWAR
jgi:hypothetical protein